jgi:hypothetical protein
MVRNSIAVLKYQMLGIDINVTQILNISNSTTNATMNGTSDNQLTTVSIVLTPYT